MSADTHREPTERFTDRVELYTRHRPGYPPELLEHFHREMALATSHVVADVGSGTGKLSELLLRAGNTVYGIEPNRSMREAAERLLAGHARFHSLAGTAERTGLGDHGVDLIVAAQAFHWFRMDETRREFARIGREGAWTALVWNTRLPASAASRAYEDLLDRLGTDYRVVDHRKTTAASVLDRFFDGDGYRSAAFANPQTLDREGLRGRALSASYVPLPGRPDHDAFMDALERIFDEHQRGGVIVLDQQTEVYWGHVGLD